MLHLTHTVAPQEDDLTLRQLLRGAMGLSARQIREAKAVGGVTVDGMPWYDSQRVGAGRTITVTLCPYAQPAAPVREATPLQVLYEDDALLGVCKPALLQCHPSPSAPRGSDTLEARVQAYLRAPAHPVHRLDAETCGVVLFAKLPFAQARLQQQMAQGGVAKTYQAWLCGVPDPPTGCIDAPIARVAPDSFTRAVREDGQRAVSSYAVLRTVSTPHGVVSLASLSPQTGRTHQLRVHMAHIGCPLLGDTRYGTDASHALSAALGASYHQLCAVSLRFAHPVTGAAVDIACAPTFSVDPDAFADTTR